MKNIGLILCVFFCLVACQQHSSIENHYQTKYQIHFQKEVDESFDGSQATQVEYIALDDTLPALLYGIDKLKFANGLIYAGDFHNDKIIVFDEQGKYQFNIDKRGQGPGEYLEIKSFTVDSQCVYVIDNYNHKLFAYDCRNGAFKYDKPLPIVTWDVEILPNGGFLLAFVPMSQPVNMEHSNHLLFVTDADMQITQRLFPYKQGEGVDLSYINYFNDYGENEIIFSSLMHDGYTVIPRHHIDSLYHVGIVFENPIPNEQRLDYTLWEKHGYEYMCMSPIVCGNYVSFSVPGDKVLALYLYDKKRHKLIHNRTFFLPIASHNGRFVQYIGSEEVYNYLVKKGNFPPADAQVEEAIRHEGMALMFCSLE